MDPYRFQEQFFSLMQMEPAGSLASLLDLGTEVEISQMMDACPLQDSFRYRGRHIGLKVAHLLIDDKGELDRGRLTLLRKLLSASPYILGPQREGDFLL